jgi:hypothetical protein
VNPARGGTVALLTVLLLAGCGGRSSTSVERPLVVGSIESVIHRATQSGIRVTGGPGSSEPCGIVATVDADTEVVARTGDGQTRVLTPGDLDGGDTVEVYVDGPVAESCPVQGRASRIVRLSRSS